MLEIEKPIIECVESNEDGTYGKYVVEPLEKEDTELLLVILLEEFYYHLYQVLQQHQLKLMEFFMSSQQLRC